MNEETKLYVWKVNLMAQYWDSCMKKEILPKQNFHWIKLVISIVSQWS